MSHAGVIRPLVAITIAALLGSSVSCNHDDQQALTDQEALIATLAPDVATVYINFTCGADTTIGLFDSNGPQKKPAWAFMRHPNGPKNQISWEVAQNAQPVTINSIGDKPGQGSFPIDPGNQQGGQAGVPWKATVKPGAGAHGAHSDTTYNYSIGVTCKPAAGPDIHFVIDPEMIVRKP